MSFACRVSGCRYSTTHKTSQHRCGVCWEFGHGVVEHGTWQRILDVASVAANEGDASYPTCTIPGCHASHTHTDSGHHCVRCRRRCDADHNCIVSNVSNESPLPVQDAYAKLRQRLSCHAIQVAATNSYMTVRSFGHAWTVIIHPNGRGECAFLHSDAQGQYTPESDDRDIIQWFKGSRTSVHYSMSPPPALPPAPPPAPVLTPAAITGFSPLLNRMHAEAGLPPPAPAPAPAPVLPVAYSDSDSDDDREYHSGTTTDKCPVCRARVVKPGGVTEVFGVTVTDNCSICLSEPVSWIFTGCGHMAVCKECAQRWV